MPLAINNIAEEEMGERAAGKGGRGSGNGSRTVGCRGH